MRNYHITFCGLEADYMKKLALYMKQRLQGRADVGIWEGELFSECLKEAKKNEGQCLHHVWIGSAECIRWLEQNTDYRHLIIMRQEQECELERDSIFQYQPCSGIYAEFWQCCKEFGICESSEGVPEHQGWIYVTGKGISGSCMPFAVMLARGMNKNGKVLLVTLSECSGIRELLLLEEGHDFADLVLGLRSDPEMGIEHYVGQIEGLDFILPSLNPMHLYEVTDTDMDIFLRSIRKKCEYKYVVFLAENCLQGTDRILRGCSHVFLLKNEDAFGTVCANGFRTFYKMCMDGMHQDRLSEIASQRVYAGTPPNIQCGRHLVWEWEKAMNGQVIDECIRKIEGSEWNKDGG